MNKDEIPLNSGTIKKLQIRKRKTKHEGGTPLKVPTINDKNKSNIKMEGKEIMKLETWSGLTKTGASILTGIGVSRLATGIVNNAIPDIPMRGTLGSGLTSIGLYVGYKNAPNKFGAKNLLRYAAAGSAAFTFGVFIGEATQMLGVQLPGIANEFLGIATGAPLVTTETQGVDVDTVFQ